jgi:hypothetical protein
VHSSFIPHVCHARTASLLGGALIMLVTGCSEQRGVDTVLSANVRGSDGSLTSRLDLTLRDSILAVGDTATATAATFGGKQGEQRSLRFRSTDTTIVGISRTGLVTALRVGSVAISVRWFPNGDDAPALTAEIKLRVKPPAMSGAPSDSAFVAAALPRATVNIDTPSPRTRSIRIPAGNATALQAALDSAVNGDEIILPDGATYLGSFLLRKRADNGTVVIRSATIPTPSRERVTVSRAGSMATLLTNTVAPALTTDAGANGWRIVGVRLRLADGVVENYGIVVLGTGGETNVAAFPRNIVFDRVVISGSPTGDTSRCLSMNGISLAVIDSWLMECHARGREAQGIAAWTGTGPLLVENNHIEGAGAGMLLGGADPKIPGVTQRDVTIRRNHIFKPLAWGGGRWSVKAAFEIKNAERVLFEGNVIENHWADAQNGFAVLLLAGSQDNTAPWSAVRDITLRLNVIRNSRSGINILSRYITPGFPPVDPSRRIVIRDNLFDAVGQDPITGQSGRYVQILGDLEDATIMQNTFLGTNSTVDVLFDGDPTVRFSLLGNVFAAATYGIIGSGFGEGAPSIARFIPGGTIRNNVLAGVQSRLYPPGSFFPAALSTSDFVNPAGGDFSLRAETGFSRLAGSRVGVDGIAVRLATAGVTIR